jgi:SAM-dependent methyltransferase
MSSYLEVVKEVYAEAAREPDAGLCSSTSPVWELPELHVPPRMLAMNYGCGSTVDPRDLRANDTIVYVGVGGGLEALQFAYFTRRPGSVIAIDPVAEMRERAMENFAEAAQLNPWFKPEFVTLVDGSALELPIEQASATVAAQNCLFNVFEEADLAKALQEVQRVLKPGGRLFTSDPITAKPLPPELTGDDRLRARCISGCLTFERYLRHLAEAGFGRIDVRSRVPYRLLTPYEYPALEANVLLESIELAAFKVPPGPDGALVNTGRMAIYAGPDEFFDMGQGQVLERGVPVPVADSVAQRLSIYKGMVLTPPTYRGRGTGCC